MTLTVAWRSDAALVRRALADRQEAFEALVLRYERRAHAIARAIGVEPDSLDDVIQESFLQAFRGLAGLRDPAAFGPWLLGIVRNVARKSFRGRAGGELVLDDDLDRLEGSDEREPLEGRELAERLRREVMRLPEATREAVFLYYYEGRSVRRVAQMLRASRSAVKQRLQRGRDLLRERLWSKLGDELREKLPSAREWGRRGRTLALLVIAAAAAPRSTSGAAPAGAASPVTAGLIMTGTNKVGLSALLAALLLAGGLVVLMSLDRSASGPEDRSKIAAEPRVSAPAGPPAAAADGGIAADTADASGPTGIAGTVFLEGSRASAGVNVAAVRAGAPRRYAARAATRADGSYVLEGIEPGRYRLWAWSGPWTMKAEGDVEDVAVRRGEVSSGHDLVLVPGVIVRGIVLEELTRKPIPRALVHLYWTAFAEADDGGRFTLEGVPGGQFRLFAEGEGHASGCAMIDAAPGEEPFVTFELGRGGTIEGIVYDFDGKPAEGATVGVHGSVGSGAGTLTDREGRYRVSGIPLGATDIEITASRAGLFAAQVTRESGFPRGETRLVQDLRLSKGYALEGCVLDVSGQGLAGAELSFGACWFLPDIDVVRCDDRGRFSIDGMTEAICSLTARRQGFAPAELDLRSLPAERREDVRLVLKPGLTVAGMVVDVKGVPLEDAFVAAGDSRDGHDWDACSRTGADGLFLIHGVPGEEVEIAAAKEGFTQAEACVRPGEGGIVLVLERAAEISGIAIDAETGDPVHPILVKVDLAEEPEAAQENRNRHSARGLASELGDRGLQFDREDGGFAIRRELCAGLFYRLIVSAEGYADAVLDPIEAMVPSQEIEAHRVVAELDRAAVLRGRVIDAASGKPIAGATVRHALEKWAPVGLRRSWTPDPDGIRCLRRALTGEDGTFEARGIPRDPALLFVEKRGFGKALFLDVVPSSDEQIFALAAAASIEGRIADAAGRPLPEALVQISAGDCTMMPEPGVLSDADGRYRIDDLPAGEAEVTCVVRGAAPQRIVASLVAGAATTVDFTKPAGSIRGMVTAQGVPIADASVFARSAATGGHASTDRSGAFCIEGVPPGNYEVSVSRGRENCAGAQRTVAVQDGEVQCDLSVGSVHEIKGRVVDGQTGKPVAGAEVELFSRSPDAAESPVEIQDLVSSFCFEVRTETAPGGRFEFGDACAGTSYFLQARAPLPGEGGERPAAGWSGPIEFGETASPSEIVIALGGRAALDVTVVDAARESPVADAKVNLKTLAGHPACAARKTDAAGRATFGALRSGPYLILIEGADRRVTAETIELPEGRVERTILLRSGTW